MSKYYNTTNAYGDLLKDYEARAISQDEVVIGVFRIYKKPLSPSMILELSGMNCPLTSVRRSMTNLTREGKLEKTDTKVNGIYDRPEYLWKLLKKKVAKNKGKEIQGKLDLN